MRKRLDPFSGFRLEADDEARLARVDWQARPLFVSLNPWIPRVEYLRPLVSLRRLVDLHGARVNLHLRHHLTGTQPPVAGGGGRPAYWETQAEADACLQTILRWARIDSRVVVRPWLDVAEEAYRNPDFHRYLESIDPRDAAKAFEGVLATKKGGMGDMWATVTDYFLASSRGSPVIMSDPARVPLRRLCQRKLAELGRSCSPILAQEPIVEDATPWTYPVQGVEDAWRDRWRGLSSADRDDLVRWVVEPTAALSAVDASAVAHDPIEGGIRVLEDVVRKFRAAEFVDVDARRADGPLDDPVAVERALAALRSEGARRVMRCLYSTDRPLTLGEILTSLATTKRSSVQNWLDELVDADLVRRRGGRYVVTRRPLDLRIG